MKTKLMRFITSFLRVGEKKKVLANQPESIVEHTDITVVRSTNHPLAERVKTAPVSLTDQVNRFLQSTYDFRYNLLTEETEYRPADGRGEPLHLWAGGELNSFCLEAHARGIACWDKDISRYLYSTSVPGYHPFLLYLDELPAWMALIVLKHWRTVFLLIHCG